MPSKHFHELMERCREIHDRKSHDYAESDNPFSNFEKTAEIVSWFKNPIDQVFACMIGIKLSRMAELSNGKSPKNESLDDSHVDLTNYCGLWGAYKRSLVIDPEVKQPQSGADLINTGSPYYRGAQYKK